MGAPVDGAFRFRAIGGRVRRRLRTLEKARGANLRVRDGCRGGRHWMLSAGAEGRMHAGTGNIFPEERRGGSLIVRYGEFGACLMFWDCIRALCTGKSDGCRPCAHPFKFATSTWSNRRASRVRDRSVVYKARVYHDLHIYIKKSALRLRNGEASSGDEMAHRTGAQHEGIADLQYRHRT